jgi:cell division protein FtsW
MTASTLASRDRARFDMTMVALTAALVGIGIVAVFSATFARAALSSSDSFHMVKRQATWALIGAGAMLLTARLSIARLRELAYPAAIVAALLLILVLGLGVEINGARRWFGIGLFHLQPSELAKLAVIVAVARFAVDDPRRVRSLWGLLAPMGLAGGLASLVVIEPDLGTAVVIMALAFLVCHFAGARMRHLGAFVALGVVFVAVAIIAKPYRWERIRAWRHPDETALSSGYQLRHAVIALGAGGLFGRGLGESREKYYYLPAAETDCIFAIIGEEMGLIGTWGLLALFGLLLWRGMVASLQVADPFCALVGAGATALIALQVLLNVAVVTGLAPTKGAPLPFVSYGGSSLVFGMAAVGLMLNVSRQPGRRRAPLPPAVAKEIAQSAGRADS